MEEKIGKYIRGILDMLPSEELYMEAVREIVKDMIKEYIKRRISNSEELKKDITDAIEGYIEGKVKEYDAMAKMAKVTAKIGLMSAPENVKEEVEKDFLQMFRKEIEEIISKTL